MLEDQGPQQGGTCPVHITPGGGGGLCSVYVLYLGTDKFAVRAIYKNLMAG